MLPDNHPLFPAFEEVLLRHKVPSTHYPYYKKWLRYFLDFCEKHPEIDERSEKIRRFLEKLISKGQSPLYCRQATHAITLFIEMGQQPDPWTFVPETTAESAHVDNPVKSHTPGNTRHIQYVSAGYQVKSDSPEWDEVMEKLAAEIKVRHYSRGPCRFRSRSSPN